MTGLQRGTGAWRRGSAGLRVTLGILVVAAVAAGGYFIRQSAFAESERAVIRGALSELRLDFGRLVRDHDEVEEMVLAPGEGSLTRALERLPDLKEGLRQLKDRVAWHPFTAEHDPELLDQVSELQADLPRFEETALSGLVAQAQFVSAAVLATGRTLGDEERAELAHASFQLRRYIERAAEYEIDLGAPALLLAEDAARQLAEARAKLLQQSPANRLQHLETLAALEEQLANRVAEVARFDPRSASACEAYVLLLESTENPEPAAFEEVYGVVAERQDLLTVRTLLGWARAELQGASPDRRRAALRAILAILDATGQPRAWAAAPLATEEGSVYLRAARDTLAIARIAAPADEAESGEVDVAVEVDPAAEVERPGTVVQETRGDLDGDGHLDLVMILEEESKIAIAFGNEAGSYEAALVVEESASRFVGTAGLCALQLDDDPGLEVIVSRLREGGGLTQVLDVRAGRELALVGRLEMAGVPHALPGLRDGTFFFAPRLGHPPDLSLVGDVRRVMPRGCRLGGFDGNELWIVPDPWALDVRVVPTTAHAPQAVRDGATAIPLNAVRRPTRPDSLAPAICCWLFYDGNDPREGSPRVVRMGGDVHPLADGAFLIDGRMTRPMTDAEVEQVAPLPPPEDVQDLDAELGTLARFFFDLGHPATARRLRAEAESGGELSALHRFELDRRLGESAGETLPAVVARLEPGGDEETDPSQSLRRFWFGGAHRTTAPSAPWVVQRPLDAAGSAAGLRIRLGSRSAHIGVELVLPIALRGEGIALSLTPEGVAEQSTRVFQIAERGAGSAITAPVHVGLTELLGRRLRIDHALRFDGGRSVVRLTDVETGRVLAEKSTPIVPLTRASSYRLSFEVLGQGVAEIFVLELGGDLELLAPENPASERDVVETCWRDSGASFFAECLRDIPLGANLVDPLYEWALVHASAEDADARWQAVHEVLGNTPGQPDALRPLTLPEPDPIKRLTRIAEACLATRAGTWQRRALDRWLVESARATDETGRGGGQLVHRARLLALHELGLLNELVQVTLTRDNALLRQLVGADHRVLSERAAALSMLRTLRLRGGR